MTNRIGMILDEKVADATISATAGMPLWIVETPQNSAFIDGSRKESGKLITSFGAREGESKTDLAGRIVYALDEHHGEHCQDHPYDTLLVSGLTLNELKKEAFLDLGFSEFEETHFGFVARKVK